MTTKNSLDEKRKARKKMSGEDFTPESLTEQILDKLNQYGKESWNEGKSFLDPACGDGGLLIPVLKRKLSLGHNPLISIQSIYGTDIMADNISECRTRLLEVLINNNVTITNEHIKAVLKNIVCTPLHKFKNGSLDYDFEFKTNPKQRDIDRWYNKIVNGQEMSSESSEDEEPIESPKPFKQRTIFDEFMDFS